MVDRLAAHARTSCQGIVTTLNITNTFETPPSTHTKLTVAYSPDAPAELPQHLFLKMPKAHKLARGKREVDFYATIAPLMPTVPLVPCLGTSLDAATGMSYLLLEDVSATHSTSERGVLSWNHRGNFLIPHKHWGRVYIIDWHQYRCWWGPKDIVGLINRCLAPQQYHQAERLLRAYYEQLLEHGVTNYSWEECRQDYRLGVVDYLTVVLDFLYYPEWFFTRQFTATMHEFQAWGCAELLE